jgi:hypothetical protein
MIHCLFEQSGTFKNAFKKFGYEAVDYDIENQFNQTDFVVDIFKEIEKYSIKENSIFDKMIENDLIIAFFPCTYFSVQSQLNSRGVGNSVKKYTQQQKQDYAMLLAIKRSEYFRKLLSLINIALSKKIKLIIENPAHCNYILNYLPEIYNIVKINNRRLLGDCFKKPTVFLFYNFEPKFILYQIQNCKEKKIIYNLNNMERSIMNPIFAENFIKNFIEL